MHVPLGCQKCAAISTVLSSRYPMPTCWSGEGDCQTPPVPAWIGLFSERHDWDPEGDFGDKGCRHVMMEHDLSRSKTDVVLSDGRAYLLPAKFHQVRTLTVLLFGLSGVCIPMQVACLWACKRAWKARAFTRVLSWGMLCGSWGILAASLLWPVGTAVTQRLDECRRLTAFAAEHGMDATTCERARYLLSDQAISDCENVPVDFRFPGRIYGDSESADRCLFPSNYLRRAQIRLAIAVAPCDVPLVNAFFYGTTDDLGADWNMLIKRLDARLIKRDSAYPEWMMRTGLGDRLAITITAHSRRDLRLQKVSTNRCGTVNVVWSGSEFDNVQYLSVFGVVRSEDSSCWVPLRTVACAERFPMGYLSRKDLLMW